MRRTSINGETATHDSGSGFGFVASVATARMAAHARAATDIVAFHRGFDASSSADTAAAAASRHASRVAEAALVVDANARRNREKDRPEHSDDTRSDRRRAPSTRARHAASLARASSANVVAVASVGAPTERDASIASKMVSVVVAVAAPTDATATTFDSESGSDATTAIAAARFAAVPAAYRVVVAASGGEARFAVDAATRRIVRASAKSTSNPVVGSSTSSRSSGSSFVAASASARRESPLTLTTHPAAATRAPASSPSTSAAIASTNPGAFAMASRPSGASARFLAAPAAASRHSGKRDRARRVKPEVHPDARDANADADDVRDARFPMAIAACAAADARVGSASSSDET